MSLIYVPYHLEERLPDPIVDPGELPGPRYPAPGGPGLESVAGAARMVVATGRVAALNIACTWDSGHPDSEGVRERLLTELLRP